MSDTRTVNSVQARKSLLKAFKETTLGENAHSIHVQYALKDEDN